MPYLFFSLFFLATSADRFYRIDRSQVCFLEPARESEKFPSKCALLVSNLINFSNKNAETHILESYSSPKP